MTAPPTLELIPSRAPVQVLRTFQRPTDNPARPTREDLLVIPCILREQPNWVLYDLDNDKNGKPTKVPYQPSHPSKKARTNKPSTWDTFDQAVASMNGHAGLGCVTTKERNWVFIDWDHVIVNGELPVWMQRILEQIRSYAEASPSGTGIHQIVQGTVHAGHKYGCLEMYSEGRFFTFTGNRLLSHPTTIEAVNVDWLYRLLTARVFDFTRNPKLKAFLNGDITGYPSPSEADMGFCSQLAGLGLAAEDIDRLVRLSELYRDKWDEKHGAQTYGEMTIQKVLESQRNKPVIACSVAVGSGEQWRTALLKNKTGTIKPLLANVLLVLRNDPKYQGLVSYNELALTTVIQRQTPWGSKPGAIWTDFDDSQFAALLQQDGIAVNTRIAAEAVGTIAQETPFHPVRTYLRLRVWDGKQRVDSWLSVYLGAEANDYTHAVGRCWLISAIARAMIPGVQVDHLLLLLGIQGSGKSSGLRALFGADFFSDRLSPLGSKDSYVELQGVWCVELSELSAMRRSEIEATKSFLTARVDHVRLPYARRAQALPRQCVFCGTSNDQNPFSDPTGSRRFWPVRTGKIDIPALTRDRDQLWAEAVALFDAGEKWWFESPELIRTAAREADEHYAPGVWDDQILDWCEHPTSRFKRVDDQMPGEELPFDSRPFRVTLSDVLVHCIGKTLDKFLQSDLMQVQRCLVHNSWKRLPQSRVSGTNRRVRFYELPTPQSKESL